MLGAHSPADMFYSRFIDWTIKTIVGKAYVNATFGHDEKYVSRWWGHGGSDIDVWAPKCNYLNAYYNKSRDLVRLVGYGLVEACGKVENVSGKTITCQGLSHPFEVDVIIYATGYKYMECMGFSKKYAIQKRYKHIFPEYESNDIAFIGYIRPYLTSIPMLIEMQSRLVAKVFAKKVRLPSKSVQRKVIHQDIVKHAKEFPCSHDRIPFLVDPYDYCNSLANLMDMKPNYLWLLITDPYLAYCLLFDSWNHFAYRLNDTDPMKRTLARKMILEYHDHKTVQKIRNTGLAYVRDVIVAIFVILPIFIVIVYLLFTRKSICKSNESIFACAKKGAMRLKN